MSRSGKIAVLIFWGWVLLNLILWAISLVDGNLHILMMRAVDYAIASGTKTIGDRSLAAWSFVYISLAYFVVTTGLGALLVHKSARGRRWALRLLFPAALWWAYASISAPARLNQMYPGTIGWFEWFLGLLGGIVWVVILTCCTVRVRRGVAP